MPHLQTFSAHGKLLITNEYFVLDGAKSLALPTKFSQNLIIKESPTKFITWKSFDHQNILWLEVVFSCQLDIIQTNNQALALRLQQILRIEKDHSFFENGLDIETHLDFNRAWGLGTSSTLIANISEWLGLNPYYILKKTFGGSGYDIACASANGPIEYKNKPKPFSNPVLFNPSFKANILFVYLNKKQNSRESMRHYNGLDLEDKNQIIAKLNQLTQDIITCKTLDNFLPLIDAHENIIAKNLKLSKIKDLYFQDYDGSVKSLGGWGGDFILCVSPQSIDYSIHYFKQKGYTTVFKYEDIIL